MGNLFMLTVLLLALREMYTLQQRSKARFPFVSKTTFSVPTSHWAASCLACQELSPLWSSCTPEKWRRRRKNPVHNLLWNLTDQFHWVACFCWGWGRRREHGSTNPALHFKTASLKMLKHPIHTTISLGFNKTQLILFCFLKHSCRI